ncbi:MAG: hypothetical protein HON53_01530 [Planctomycetaceae bacterium]|nr:hypothetical protein [Planctomycetaceae bacterium]MBT6155176.1 hypothetical protein [Planctomycetaceae bacterium]MBT6483308.1 hypothetical protein [Planctomycetaceae bacterium]MBT6494635.1 hypothetical protein [Planctomycetaceae bacterium]
MKAFRLIIAIIAALWTVGVAVGVIQELGTHQGVRGTTQMFAGAGATLACLAITVWLFTWALRRDRTGDEETKD